MQIKPFRAFRFDEQVVGNVGDCIAPPYDVISEAQREYFYNKSNFNIVRITKGKTSPDNGEKNNQYTRAADFFNQWIEKGVLKQDETESIYAYVQDFDLNGSNIRRSSFIALGKLEELGKAVKPHENTLDGPKTDRLRLQLACRAKFGLVFMLYKDPSHIADNIIDKSQSRRPAVDFVDEQSVRHRLFQITDKVDIDAISAMMLDKNCIIADGHHRYETALNYYKQTGNPAAAWQMLAFANARSEGLVVLATHRLVDNVRDFDFEKLLRGLEENFELTKYEFNSPDTKIQAKQKMLSRMKADFDADKNSFGIYGGEGSFLVAVLKNKKVMDSAVPAMSRAWRTLDVAVLHKLIIEQLLGIGTEQLAAETNLEYVKDTPGAIDDSIAKVDSGQKQLAFFMNPPKPEQIFAVAEAGEKMPQKSTYFYPKIYTGLTINKL